MNRATSPRVVTTIYTSCETPILDAELFDECTDYRDDEEWIEEYANYLTMREE